VRATGRWSQPVLAGKSEPSCKPELDEVVWAAALDEYRSDKQWSHGPLALGVGFSRTSGPRLCHDRRFGISMKVGRETSAIIRRVFLPQWALAFGQLAAVLVFNSMARAVKPIAVVLSAGLGAVL
jgi:hypothetical protein